MNAHTKFLKTGAEAKALVAKEQHKTTGVPPLGQVDNDETVSKLPVWQRTSTTLAAKYVSFTGAAILAKSGVANKDLPRVHDWKKILKDIDWNKRGLVAGLLRDVIFWHHKSTSGRFNDEIGRFERWGMKSISDWNSKVYKVPNPDYKKWEGWHGPSKSIEKKAASRASFCRHKDRLVKMGLIEAQSHLWSPTTSLWKGKTYLWIKPTKELCRIVFEPGYWQTVRAKYAYVPTKKKPRGLSAKAKNETSGLGPFGPPASKNETSG
jgi:hypothetical protein